MLLGDLLARFDDETFATETVLGLGDLALTARLREKAAASGLALGAYAAAAMRRYAAEATDEEWLALLSALGRAQDPGMICMRRALAYVAGGLP